MTGESGPVIVTGRLELWKPQADDLDAMFAIVSDRATGRHLGGGTAYAEHFERFCRNAGSWGLFGHGAFILRRPGADAPIGNCGIFRAWRGLGDDFDGAPEAGWILRADCTGQGLAGEAMRAAFAWFEGAFGAQRITCMIAPENAPSLTLAEKLGFSLMRDAQLPGGGETVRLFERLP